MRLRWRRRPVKERFRYFGEVDASAENCVGLIKRISGKYDRSHFCYEAGSTGCGLHFTSLKHDCTVVAPFLIPRKPGDCVETNRRDAVTLAKFGVDLIVAVILVTEVGDL
jgi:transposase